MTTNITAKPADVLDPSPIRGDRGDGAPAKQRRGLAPRHLLPLILLGASACHPLACCTPADLPKDAPLVLAAESDRLNAPVDVAYDELGIPHIYGESEPDLAYALGFMHGRDRQFQIYIYVHAALGRLTELLGEGLLPVDRDNRLLTYQLDEQVKAVSDRDRAILLAYADGLNQGSRYVGRSAEMQVLGVDWEDVGIREVLAVMRLQQWSQSAGLDDEMARHRMRKALPAEVFAELWVETPSRGEPIVSAESHSGDAFTFGADRQRDEYLTRFHQGPGTSRARSAQPPTGRTKSTQQRLVKDVLDNVRTDVGRIFGGTGKGASNSWAVSGALTASGNPVLCNDPHLGHSAPGVFYMVHMSGPDFDVVGGTFPGLPAVLIGHGQHVAWGITNAAADIQDVLVLNTIDNDQQIYVVDDNPIHLTPVVNRYKLGKGADADVVEEIDYESIFGPVLPDLYGEGTSRSTPWVEPGERLVLQWTASHFPEEMGNLISAFWDLAQAENIDQVHEAVQHFASPAMNLAIAIHDSDGGDAGIHYRLSGIIPVRGDDQRVDIPRSATSRRSGMVGVLPSKQKPQLDNPELGYLVASNQRVVDNNDLSQRFVGYEGIRPWRANRIHERLRELLADGNKPSRDEICVIQQDIESIEARELASVLGKHCPKTVPGYSDDVVGAFCDSVGDFDGVYDLEAQAQPFARLTRAVTEVALSRHLDDDLRDDVIGRSFVQMTLHGLLLAADSGAVSPALYDDPATTKREGIDELVADAAVIALDILTAELGTNPDDWKWERQHTLAFKGILASAPVVGGLFETGAHPETGTSNVPRAEDANPNDGLRCSFGAGLRLHAEMGEKPTIGMINDIGNSGHFGHRHLEDQYPLWTKGETRELLQSQGDVEAVNDGLLRLEPK